MNPWRPRRSESRIRPNSGVGAFSMRGFICNRLSRVLAALVVLGATTIPPDTVLCVGPGNHCHFETVVGAICGDQGPRSPSSVPRDGCPRGSKDIGVSFPAQRSDNNFTPTAFALALAVSLALVKLFAPSHKRPSVPRFAYVQGLPITTVILRC
jgi:hypothetical protein